MLTSAFVLVFEINQLLFFLVLLISASFVFVPKVNASILLLLCQLGMMYKSTVRQQHILQLLLTIFFACLFLFTVGKYTMYVQLNWVTLITLDYYG